MILNDIQLIPYEVELDKPLLNSKNNFYKKKGYYIKIKSHDCYGYGEVCVLENFSTEIIADINNIFLEFYNCCVFDKEVSFIDLLALVEYECHKSPSLIFGLNTALYDIQAKKKNISIAEYINKNNAQVISLSSIYNHQAIKNFQFIKIKMLESDIKVELTRINTILKNFNKNIIVRLDANQLYEIEDILWLDKNIDHSFIQYIEEPICSPTIDNYIYLNRKTEFKYAIDESLYIGNDWIFVDEDIIDYLVVKPSILGSYKTFFDVITKAKKQRIDIVLSSALETFIGNMAIVNLASAISNNMHHGISIHLFYDSYKIYDNYEKIYFENIIGLGAQLND
tara:strand:- start:265 stop:1281 length:1017 start_codon:yes stop_codon:yes gene_type:complete